MASAKDIWVIQSPKTMAIGEAQAHSWDFVSVGTPGAVNSEKCYDASGAEQAALLTGATSIVGTGVLGKLFTPTTAGNHRLVMSVTISGNTVFSSMDVTVFDVKPVAGAITSGSYGSILGVASLVPKHANRAGLFDDTTRPSGTYIATLIDQTSALLNSILAEAGFTTPVTNTTVKPMLDLFVNQEVAAMVEGINGSGRYGPTTNERKGGSKGRFEIMLDSVRAFVEGSKNGMERMGASRTYNAASGVLFREMDESGDDVPPLFQREAFGETYQQWDRD